MKEKRFFLGTLGSILLILGVAVVTNYVIDPLQFYRKSTFYRPYYSLEQRYQNPGLVKNYLYDTLIVGTSMTENFIPSIAEGKLGGKVVKASSSGSSAREQYLIAQLALRENNPKRVIWGLEYSAFRGDWQRVRSDYGPFPYYLYDQNPFNDLRYLLNWDTLKYSKEVLDLSRSGEGLERRKNLDKLNYWGNDVSYSAALTIESYESYKKIEDFAWEEYTWSYLKDNVDKNLIPLIEKNPQVNFVLYFPPYSILRYRFFYEKDPKYFLNELRFKEYVFEKLIPYSNVEIHDFQPDEKIIFQLDNYKDISHHKPEINSYIIDALKIRTYRVTSETMKNNLEKLKDLVIDIDMQKIIQK